jgi:hypothetical protein
VVPRDSTPICGFDEECRSTTRCSGDVLEFCAAGVRSSLDCRALGFAGCGEGSDPFDEVGESRCL